MDQRAVSKVIVIEAEDNVAVALVDLEAGAIISAEGRAAPLRTAEPIPQGHKVALKEIAAGSWIIKYGERIGTASAAIAAGGHVHIHNVNDITEELVSERRPV